MVYAQLIDTGFILMVIGSCVYALTSTKDRSSARSREWIEELSTLQGTLKELIGEASAAGSNLDRTLLKRKQELEMLLKKIETAQAESAAPKAPLPEVPNETWLLEPKKEKPKVQRQEPQPRASRPAAPDSLRESELAKRIEVLLESKRATHQPVSEDVVDPVAYKVARRLLVSGKEIHVVARKVGLPVEEIRVLDSMIREEQGIETAMTPDTHSIARPEPVLERPTPTSYSRGKRLESPTYDSWSDELNGLLEAQEEELIRRETTLL